MNQNRIELLKSEIIQNPNDPFYPYALALEYKDSAADKCLKQLEEVLLKFPDYLPIFYQLGELYADFEMYEESKKIYQRGIELAEKKKDLKTLSELKNAYQNILYED